MLEKSNSTPGQQTDTQIYLLFPTADHTQPLQKYTYQHGW